MRNYDLAIVGAGIAGLAIGEIFSRSGHRVVLLEKGDRVCGEASSAHHAWFHFGSLYSIFANNQFMRTLVGGVDDLLSYYRAFSGMNISIGKDGKLEFGDEEMGWIRDEPIQYIVSARNDKDFALDIFDGVPAYLRKVFFTLTWDLAIKQFISRHQRFHKFDWRTGPASENIPRAGWLDYSRDVIHKVGDIDVNLDKHTHFRVQGFDRPMNTASIIADLLRSFLASDGDLQLGNAYLGHMERGGRVEVEAAGGTITADRIIVAAGRHLGRLLAPGIEVNVVTSPLLVVYPSVCDQHFVRLTPFGDRTINHLLHRVGGEGYSLIGGGYSADPDDAPQVERAKSQLLEMAVRVLPRVRDAVLRHVYVSHKTEVIARRGERNYQYVLRRVSDRTYAAVPGKFSLGFSLAVNTYRRLTGQEPRVSVDLSGAPRVADLVAPMYHQGVVEQLLAERAARRRDLHPVRTSAE